MIPSKDILDYFVVPFVNIRPDELVPFDMFLYFSRSEHIMLWRRKGEVPSKEFIQGFRTKGMEKVWISRDEAEIYHKYMENRWTPEEEAQLKAELGKSRVDRAAEAAAARAAELSARGADGATLDPVKSGTGSPGGDGDTEEKTAAAEAAAKAKKEAEAAKAEAEAQAKAETEAAAVAAKEAAEKEAEAAKAAAELEAQKKKEADAKAEEPEFKTKEGAEMSALLNDPNLGKEEKKEAVAQKAQSFVAEAAKAANASEQAKKNQKLQDIVSDILSGSAHATHPAVSQIWRMANVDADVQHGVTVATYAAIFALAFGRIDADLLGDLALAGLLHDIGLSQVPFSANSKAWKKQSEAEMTTYVRHVHAGLELIERLIPDTPPRVKKLISYHHEKFDGTGYPERRQGFAVDDVGQILAMADLLDSISIGRWDGTEYPLKDTLNTLEKLEKSRTFPEHFNPDVFGAVMTWVRSEDAGAARVSAQNMVASRAKGIIQDGSASGKQEEKKAS